MLIQKSFLYELRPDGATRRTFLRFSGAKRFVWNKALSQKSYGGYYKNSSLLPIWKVDNPWLREISAQVLQQGLKDLDRAHKYFLAGRANFPTMKKKGKCKDSFRFVQDFKIEAGNGRLYLPRIGWVRYRNSRALSGTAKSVVVLRRGEKWFASIQTELEAEQPSHESMSQVGIDLGVVRFATLSDGSFVEPLNAYRKQAYRLRRYQRAMDRKITFSKNWNKAKISVVKVLISIANSRKDFLHKLTSGQTKTHSLICIEDLKVSNMTRSSSGSDKEPDRRVKQKSGLSKSILDQGWYEFRRQLEYKSKWLGGRVVAVPAMNTSRRCPACDHISKDNRKTQSTFVCVECGFTANADYVGALNVKAAGLAVIEGEVLDLACGGDLEVRGPVKQEPTERKAQAFLVGVPFDYVWGGSQVFGCPAERRGVI